MRFPLIAKALVLLTALSPLFTIATDRKPNLVVILTDDQGYEDVGCFGSPLIRTPNLDRMAAEGCRLTSFYAGASVCSPSRAGLLTGRYPARIGIRGVYFPHKDTGMPLREITLPEMLKPQGYVSACIGKWHLGHLPQFLPTRRGFDYYFGIPYSNDMWLDAVNIPPAADMVLTGGKTQADYLNAGRERKKSVHMVPLMRNEKCIEWPADQAALTRRYAQESVRFIQEHSDQPFFLHVAPAMPHVPLFASDEFRGKSPRGLYGDCIEEIDWAVGEILRTLKEENLAENTLVLFTSDNGPWLNKKTAGGSAHPLRSGKNSTYEGGQRVPGIAWWPGTIPAGAVYEQTLSSLDIFPTAAAMAGARIPSDRVVDGHNILPQLRDPSAASPWDVFFYETTGLRVGKWKFRQGKLHDGYHKGENPVVVQLFDLDADPGEQKNLAKQYPEKVGQFGSMLDSFRHEVSQKP